jgi:hypothetical protein
MRQQRFVPDAPRSWIRPHVPAEARLESNAPLSAYQLENDGVPALLTRQVPHRKEQKVFLEISG